MNHNFALIRRHWKPLFILNLALIGATAYLVLNADQLSKPIWKANARLNIPTKGDKLNADLGTLGNLSDGGSGFTKEINPLFTQSAILKSDAVMGRVFAGDPEKDLYDNLSDYGELFEIEPQTQTTVMWLEAQGSSPELARKRIAMLVESYQKRLNELRQQDVKAQEQFAQSSLKTAQNDLITAQSNLNRFQQSTGLIEPQAQTAELVKAINQLRAKHTEVIAESEAYQTESKVAAAQLGINPQKAINSLRLAENKEYQSIRDKLSQIEIELSEARGIYTDKMPQVKSLLLKREELRRQLDRQVAKVLPGVAANQIDLTLNGSAADSRTAIVSELIQTQSKAAGLKQQSYQLKNQLAQLDREVNFIAKNQTLLLDLQRKYDIAEGIYKGIMAQLSQNKINAFNAYPSMQLIDGPSIDPEPTTASQKLIALGGLLATLFGSMSLLLFLESRNPLLNSKDLQQAAFPRVIGISRLRSLSLEKGLDEKAEREFQRLAAIVSSMMLENRRLMFTSATFSEGKTTVTLGLAWALVQLGFKVLVVDADLRQAEMSRRLGYPQFRRGERDPETLLPIHPGFDLMLAPLIQPHKIGEFFIRGEFERRLIRAQASDDYDYVLIDSPPVNLVSEAALMSRLIQNVMYVVRPGTSDRYAVLESLEQLKQQEAQIKGLIVNGVETRSASYRYYGNKQDLLEAQS